MLVAMRSEHCSKDCISRTIKYDHVTPMLIKLHRLSIYYRIVFKVLLLAFKAQNNMAPGYICDLIVQYVCSSITL